MVADDSSRERAMRAVNRVGLFVSTRFAFYWVVITITVRCDVTDPEDDVRLLRGR